MKDLEWRVLTDDPDSHPKEPAAYMDENECLWKPHSLNVLMTDRSGKVVSGFYSFKSKKFFKIFEVDVIAWMPMPKAYKAEPGEMHG